jgi:hypothetical protein
MFVRLRKNKSYDLAPNKRRDFGFHPTQPHLPHLVNRRHAVPISTFKIEAGPEKICRIMFFRVEAARLVSDMKAGSQKSRSVNNAERVLDL